LRQISNFTSLQNFCYPSLTHHHKYEWPDFASMGYDFAHSIRLRRALVNDVFTAFEREGQIVQDGSWAVNGAVSFRGSLANSRAVAKARGAKRGGESREYIAPAHT
jgi:hypothetical protein